MKPRWLKCERFDMFQAGHFGSLGSCVARSPGIFILVPLLVTLLLGSGVQKFSFMSDVFYLFVPDDAQSIIDSHKLQKLFPENLSMHVRGTELRFHQLVQITLVPRVGFTGLSRELWEEAALVTEAVSQISVYSEGLIYTWNDLCMKFMDSCVDNNLLSLLNTTNIRSNLMRNLTYPVMQDPVVEDLSHPLAAHLGGVVVDDGALVTAGAFKLIFMLDDSSRLKRTAAEMWSNALHHFIKKIKLKTANISCFNPQDVEQELIDNIQTAFEDNFSLIVLLVSAFTIINCMSTDWVRSKPLLGVVGLLNVILAALAGFGLSLYLGFPWQAINVVIIFLLIGIGMDGVFLLLSSWSRSELVSHDLVTRMSVTYSDAAVSLTITSLTNVLSFFVGALVPGFPCVHIFCVYAGFGLVFNYLWTITMFGAFLAISGHREHANRHCLLLAKVESKSIAENSSWLYQVFLAGGINQSDPDNIRDNKDDKMMLFFKNTVTPTLNWIPTKIMIIMIFSLYLAISILGISNIKEGLQLKNLARENSSTIPHYDAEDKFFRDYPYRIQVAIPQELDYHNETNRNQVLSLISDLEDCQYISKNPQFRQSWIHEFLVMAKENFLLFNITTKKQFLTNLKLFMKEMKTFSIGGDVKFNKDGTGVEASRFFLQTDRIDNAQFEMNMLKHLRKIAISYPFEVIVFTPHFFIFDQFTEVFDNSVLCILICCVIMAVVILIFIPNRICAIWVVFTVLSVEVGVVGLMSFWSINLDVISMIVLIMGIGFSVDFSAHVAYHYLSAEDELAPGARLAHCLYALGPPIIQGAATTILSILPLLRHPSYVIHTFSKMIFLVIFLGLLHSLLLLPVLLMLCGPGSCGGKENKKAKSPGTILSPSTTQLSDTFIYKKGKENCLRKRAFSGDVMKRKHIGSEDVLKMNFVMNGSDDDGDCSLTPTASLHLSFFKPSESDVSDMNISPIVDIQGGFRGLQGRVHSDSSYYSYQKRHLRRHMKHAPLKHIRVGPRLKTTEKCPVVLCGFKDCDNAYKDALEKKKTSAVSSFHAVSFINNNYKISQNDDGNDNKGYDDDSVYESASQSLASKSKLSSFKPESGKQSMLRWKGEGLKIVLVDHHAEIDSDNSFEDVNLDDI